MVMFKSNTLTDIKGKYAGTIFKRDRFGFHCSANRIPLRREPTSIQRVRRQAFRSLLSFITDNYTNEFRSLWESYGSKQLQWNQKFISYNLNRLIEGKPIKRYPTGVNICVNGDFEQGIEPWSFNKGFTLDNCRAHFHSTESSSIQQLIMYEFIAGHTYRVSFEIESISNTVLWIFICDPPFANYSTPGFKQHYFTPLFSGWGVIQFSAFPIIGTGDLLLTNIVID